MSKKRKDIFIVGFALFAIFFGAGNLIFPPSLGVMSGKHWVLAAFGFLLTDPVLPILGVIATSKAGGKAEDLGKRVGLTFSRTLGAISILVVGPLFSIPRTAATTYEIAIQPNLSSIPLIVTSIIFFVLTYLLAVNQGNVIDRIGKYLTPVLLIILTIIIIVSIVNPIGPKAEPEPNNYFLIGFEEGYQTMDALGASLMAGIVLTDLTFRGYKDRKEQEYMTNRAGLIAGALLFFIYGGLTYAGATGSSVFQPDMPRVELLLAVINEILGSAGAIAMSLVVSLACLTTSVGLTATTANYFNDISKGKIPYKLMVVAVVICSLFLSLLGVEGLINVAVPVLSTIYPVIIVLILMTLFDKYIPSGTTYTGAVLGAFIVSLTINLNQTFKILNGPMELIKKLPLYENGFPWIVPAIVLSILFTLYSKFKHKKGGTKV